MRIALTPICSRRHLEQHLGLRKANFTGCRLIKISGDTYQWPRWRAEWDARSDVSDELVVSTVQASIEAVKNDVGVAMGYLPTAYQFMHRDDDLVLPVPKKVTRHGECFLTYRNEDAGDEVIKTFHDWVVGVIADEWTNKKI